jgi:hypothetical protein
MIVAEIRFGPCLRLRYDSTISRERMRPLCSLESSPECLYLDTHGVLCQSHLLGCFYCGYFCWRAGGGDHTSTRSHLQRPPRKQIPSCRPIKFQKAPQNPRQPQICTNTSTILLPPARWGQPLNNTLLNTRPSIRAEILFGSENQSGISRNPPSLSIQAQLSRRLRRQLSSRRTSKRKRYQKEIGCRHV